MIREVSQFLSKRLKFLKFIGDVGVKDWIDENVICLQREQLILKKRLTAEQADFVKEEMVKALVEEILEHAAMLEVEKNKYTLTVYLIKRD